MNRIIVAGASQGGVQALRTLVAGLPKDFSAPILVVLHVGASESILPSILSDLGGLAASHARHGEPIREGRIYVAPPDRHLLVVRDRLELSHGPRENWARPAIDPLFRTAAEWWGPAVVGVVLSGALNDGTSGLYEIKRRGGLAIVQDPAEAEAPSMPKSALDNVPVDFRLTVSEISRLLVDLERQEARPQRREVGASAMATTAQRFTEPAAQTCPECGGAMRQETQGSLTRFRCHIGHVMTAEVLAAAQLEIIEQDLSVALRSLKERVALCDEMADKLSAKGDAAAEVWRHAGAEARRRAEEVQRLTDLDWMSPEAIGL
ncbi:MAG: hypothetical protein JO303_03360 [Caulobacteraceae bacterium]|nr:hypothetical protein [Caulobacteraceae bacterium]